MQLTAIGVREPTRAVVAFEIFIRRAATHGMALQGRFSAQCGRVHSGLRIGILRCERCERCSRSGSTVPPCASLTYVEAGRLSAAMFGRWRG